MELTSMADSAPTGVIVVLTTIPSADEARRLAHRLVETQLAACVQILPPQTSIYSWQGVIEEATERLLIIKTLHHLYPDLEATIVDLHPYDVPEIIALPVIDGAPDYLAWLQSSLPRQT
jgi:periplasmic divalent cation tolerance protein